MHGSYSSWCYMHGPDWLQNFEEYRTKSVKDLPISHSVKNRDTLMFKKCRRYQCNYLQKCYSYSYKKFPKLKVQLKTKFKSRRSFWDYKSPCFRAKRDDATKISKCPLSDPDATNGQPCVCKYVAYGSGSDHLHFSVALSLFSLRT